ncbi:GerAB/ArcD/ProY family transporter [Paenibacillus gansuensis]|uniref:Endospore germination permease n=1 Tax=Paenibacillus gansuensis TaxID=306542 RepID=A0ABW5PBF7_9BACL
MRGSDSMNIRQLSIIMLLYVLGGAISLLPSVFAKFAGEAAWLASIGGMGMACFFALLYSGLYKRMNAQSIDEYAFKKLGRLAGGVINLFLLLLAMILIAGNIRNIVGFLTIQLLPETPMTVLIFVVVLLTSYAMKVGLTSIARAGELFFPFILFILFIFIIFLTNDARLEELEPILGYGWEGIAKGALFFQTFPFWEMVLFLSIAPMATSRATMLRKAFLFSIIFGGAIITMLTLFCIMIEGAELTGYNVFPTFRLAQSLHGGGFFGRLEILMAGIWFVTIFFKTAVCYYVSLTLFARMVRSKEWKPFIYPFGFFMVPFTLVISPNSTYSGYATMKIIPVLTFIGGVGIPLILLASTFVGKTRGENINER